MKTSRWIRAVWALVVLGVVVPYGPLANVQAWYGSFLFWTLIGVLIIVANVLITRRFLDGEGPGGEGE